MTSEMSRTSGISTAGEKSVTTDRSVAALATGFKERVLHLAGEELNRCIQCGTCSASCPDAHLMDKSPRKLIALVRMGMKDEALCSRSIWLCTSCLLCTVRCPRGIRPKALMSALKQISEEEGLDNSDLAYEVQFMRQIRDCGRISELHVSAPYFLTHPEAAARHVSMGFELISKGKIDLRRDCIHGIKEVRRIFEELDGKELEGR